MAAESKVVFRYEIRVDDTEQRIPAGRIVHVAARGVATVEVWAELPWAGRGSRIPVSGEHRLQVFGTGHVIPAHAEHVGTALVAGLVWHLYRLADADG